MRIVRFFCFILVFFISINSIFGQENSNVKSLQATQSDVLYEALVDLDLNPRIQLLQNTLSNNFPYNIILEHNQENENDKKLVLVFPQNNVFFLDEVASLFLYFKELSLPYSLQIVFVANDEDIFTSVEQNTNYPHYEAQGSSTYIQSLLSPKNTATVLFTPDVTHFSNIRTDAFQLFNDIVQITPGSINSQNENTMVPLGFFTTIINSFANSGITYFIKGYFLTLYRLNLIESDKVLGTWHENEIPTISIAIREENTENIFIMLRSLFAEFNNTSFLNEDTNYSFFQIFSQTFFITERMFLVLIISVSAIVLFAFFNVSFVTGVHRNIHKKEFIKLWYLIPFIVLTTSVFLLVSQTIIQSIIPPDDSFVIFSFIVKILLSILFLLLFSFLQYVIKMPLTGFIYAYTLSISAAINIIVFSLVEITLAPLFIGQYIVIQISQRMRRIIPITLCLVLMTAPYLPFAFNISNAYDILALEGLTNARFGTNFLLACFMLPFQIMIIRILIRLKLWGMRLKTNRKKIVKELIIVLSVITVLITVSKISVSLSKSAQQDSIQQETNALTSIQISHRQQEQFGNILQVLEIKALENVVRYSIELMSNTTLPIYDANYPYDILSKPQSALFTLDNYPPNPLVLNFTTQANASIQCFITAWIRTEAGIEKIYIEYPIEDNT